MGTLSQIVAFLLTHGTADLPFLPVLQPFCVAPYSCCRVVVRSFPRPPNTALTCGFFVLFSMGIGILDYNQSKNSTLKINFLISSRDRIIHVM